MMTLTRWKLPVMAAALGVAVLTQSARAGSLHSPFFFQPFSTFSFGTPLLPERAVVSVLRQEGFRRMTQPVLQDDVYVLTAIDPDGDAVRLIIDAYSGQILRARLRGGPHWPQADPDDGPQRAVPRPPRQATAPPPRPREPVLNPGKATPQPPQQRSPIASPKAPAAKPAEKPPVAAAPGTRATPRVIEIAPSAAPPVAPLDDATRPSAPATPYVPPAPLE